MFSSNVPPLAPPLITIPPPAPGENPKFGKARDSSNENTSAEIIPLNDTSTDTSTNNPTSSDIPYPYSS